MRNNLVFYLYKTIEDTFKEKGNELILNEEEQENWKEKIKESFQSALEILVNEKNEKIDNQIKSLELKVLEL